MDHAKPPIPDEVLAKWQRVVDILARIVEVPAGLIMKVAPPKHHVFVTSATEGNPYTTDIAFTLDTGLYCDTVMAERSLLIVPNALKDPQWSHNPDLEHGMVFYMGFPLTWPDGSLFGTICVLDRQNNENAVRYSDLLNEFKEVVDSDLKLLVELAERQRVERALHEAQEELESRVRERTRELAQANENLRAREAELEETNTALKVLIHRLEVAKEETEDRVLWNINEQIVPYLERLKRLATDDKTRSYLTLVEANLKDITAAFPNRLSTAFSSLTPTEIEVAKLIIQGKTSKEIAGLMSIATSTIDFHRNNIRKKVGITRSSVNLRTYLSSLS